MVYIKKKSINIAYLYEIRICKNEWLDAHISYKFKHNERKEKRIIKRKKKDEKGHEDHIFGWKGGA
jgi:hypothetical protein